MAHSENDSTVPLRKEIVSHEPADHDAYLDGQYIGSFPTVRQARDELDRLAFARLRHAALPCAETTDPPNEPMLDSPVPGYRVERAAPDALEAYRLIGPDGLVYRLLRITTAPALLYAVDRTGRTCDIAGHTTFTDRTGSLELVD